MLAGSVRLAHGQRKEDSMLRAARVRQELARTLDVQFKRTDIELPGSRSGTVPPHLKGRAAKGLVPDREIRSESRNRLILHQANLRFENNHPVWFMPTGKLRETSAVIVSASGLAKSLRPRGVSGDEAPSGRVAGAGDRMEVSEPFLHPILFSFRGLDAETCIYPATVIKPSGISLPIDGASCRQYLLARGGQLATYWLDPAADFVARRCSEEVNKTLLYQINVQYRLDQKWGQVPASWTVQFYNKQGDLERTTRIDVETLRIGEPVPPELFNLQFPPETRVFDARKNKSYIVQASGTMGELSPNGELTGTVLAQPGESFVQRHKWLLTATAAVFVALAIFAILRRKAVRQPA